MFQILGVCYLYAHNLEDNCAEIHGGSPVHKQMCIRRCCQSILADVLTACLSGDSQ